MKKFQYTLTQNYVNSFKIILQIYKKTYDQPFEKPKFPKFKTQISQIQMIKIMILQIILSLTSTM
jgi:hypothetical protein